MGSVPGGQLLRVVTVSLSALPTRLPRVHHVGAGNIPFNPQDPRQVTTTTFNSSPSFPPLDDAISSVSRFIMNWDYVMTGQQIINAGLVVVAICHCLFIRSLPSLVSFLKLAAKKLVSFSDWLANLSPTKASLLEKTVAELRLMGGKGKTKVQLVESLLMKN